MTNGVTLRATASGSREPSQAELEAARCWEADDRVPGRPEMTAFRRRARLQQARWREEHGHPIGTQPIVPRPGKPARAVGSRAESLLATRALPRATTAAVRARYFDGP
jgi:hypothetical protein